MNSTSSPSSTRWVLAAVLLLLLLPLYVGLLPWAFDDAYIHWRIAGNLAAGEGPYFNPGQPVNASSAPAWTLLLAALTLLGGTTLWIGCLNAGLTVAGATVFVGLLEDLAGRPQSPWVRWPFALAYCGSVHFSGAGLMETPLALLLLGVALRLWLRDRSWSFALFAVACFVRLEFAVFAVLFLGVAQVQGRMSRPAAWLWSLAGGLPFVAYLALAFGSIVPHTATAKARVYEVTLVQAWNVLKFTLPGGPAPLGSAFRWLCLPGCVILVGLALVRSRDTREALPSWLLGGGALAIALTYLAVRTLVFPWYVPLFVVPAMLSAVALVQRSRVRWQTAGIVLLALVPFIVDLIPSSIAVFGGRSTRYRYFAENARVRKYRELGAQLSERYPGARLLSSEVGGLGDGFAGEILDGVGLISPQALEFHPMKVPSQRRSGLLGSIPAAYVERVRPELIVSMDIFAQDLLRGGWRDDYRLQRVPLYVEADLRSGAPAVLWGSSAMNVFIRRDLPPWTP